MIILSDGTIILIAAMILICLLAVLLIKTKNMIRCDDCEQFYSDDVLNSKRGSNKIICDSCVKKREKGKK